MPHSTVADILNDLQINATYVFHQDDLSNRVKSSPEAIRKAVARLLEKKRIVRLQHGLFLIVPLEYQNMGAPPPVWYIDSIMSYLKLPYYVAILTASSLHGATHQQPAEFQVVTTKQMKPLKIGRATIRFYCKKQTENIPIQKMKSDTGYFNVATPESTAFDLVKYVKAAGSLHNAATVLAELSQKIDPEKLVSIASFFDLATIQRAGYLLDTYGERQVTHALLKWISKQQPRYVPLRPRRSLKNAKRDARWHLIINDTVEIDS
ncbi:MAG: type IV toxin-antitoxin system AbiEi family antitoxin [Chlamydiales bacterium]